MKNLMQPKQEPGSVARRILPIHWTVQCCECHKWRLIPTQAQYEEIRCEMTENPFVCVALSGKCCKDLADFDYDKPALWLIDKPDIPKAPRGFKRTIVLDNDCSNIYCYYDTPTAGKRLRSSRDVTKYLDENPECKKDVSVEDFNFLPPEKGEEGKKEDEEENTLPMIVKKEYIKKEE